MSSLHEAIIPRGARQGQSQLKRTCSIFAYEDIKEVHKRRYLLQVRRHPGHTRSDYMSLIESFYFCFKAFSVNTKSPLCFLSANGSGSLLSGREKLLVSLSKRSPQQSLPKVRVTDDTEKPTAHPHFHFFIFIFHSFIFPLINHLSQCQLLWFLVPTGLCAPFFLGFILLLIPCRFLAVVPSLADSSESVSGQRPNTSVEQGYAEFLNAI